MVATSSTVLYNVAYMMFALLGLAFPLLYCFHLLDIMFISNTLLEIIRALQHTWKQLLVTAILVVFIIYCYAVVSFVYFRQYSVTEDPAWACNTLAACFYYTLNTGLLGDGTMAMPSLQQPTLSYVRLLLYKVSFFAIVNVVLVGGIVFSVIIDKFSERRDWLKSISDDRRNVCFMCDVKRDQLERGSNTMLSSFEHHVKDGHNVRRQLPGWFGYLSSAAVSTLFHPCVPTVAAQLWDYIFFLTYLKSTPETNMNGLETRIFHLMGNGTQEPDLSWLDVHRLKGPTREGESDAEN